jgi:hypothetical protein
MARQGRGYRYHPKDRIEHKPGVARAFFNPGGDQTYDVRSGQDRFYFGGWFSGGWFPGDMWWGTGDNT